MGSQIQSAKRLMKPVEAENALGGPDKIGLTAKNKCIYSIV